MKKTHWILGLLILLVIFSFLFWNFGITITLNVFVILLFFSGAVGCLIFLFNYFKKKSKFSIKSKKTKKIRDEIEEYLLKKKEEGGEGYESVEFIKVQSKDFIKEKITKPFKAFLFKCFRNGKFEYIVVKYNVYENDITDITTLAEEIIESEKNLFFNFNPFEIVSEKREYLRPTIPVKLKRVRTSFHIPDAEEESPEGEE